MDFVSNWYHELPWYMKGLAFTFVLVFGSVLVRNLASMLAETVTTIIAAVISAVATFFGWLAMLPVRSVKALFAKFKKSPQSATKPEAATAAEPKPNAVELPE